MRFSTFLTEVLAIARRSTVRTLRQPAVIVPSLLFPMLFFSINANGLDAASKIPGFPTDSYLDFAFAFPLIQASLFGAITAGADLARDIESGFFDRLSLTPMRPVALLGGMLTGVVALGFLQGIVFLTVGTLMGVDVSSGFFGMVVIVLLTVLVALGFGGIGAILAIKTGSVEAVESAFPLFFVAIFLVVDQPAAGSDRAGLVPVYRDHQPDLLPGRRHPQPGDHRLGPAGSGPRIRIRPGDSRGRHRRGCGVAQDEGGVGMGGFFDVAFAVAGRQIYKYFTNPAFLAPALFPLFFFVAFAGGLTRVADVPGFDYAAGYIAFQYVWALLQAVSMGGAFTGFSIAGDFENGFARRLMLAASNRYGIILGYTIASIVRATMTGILVTAIALVIGIPISGGFDLFGLIALALLANIAATLFGAGVAMLLRTQQAGPVIRTPIFLVLFLAPVFVPLKLLSGWLEAVARLNPFTHILEAARGFLAGDPTSVGSAFTISAILILVLALWAVFGLRRAERAG